MRPIKLLLGAFPCSTLLPAANLINCCLTRHIPAAILSSNLFHDQGGPPRPSDTLTTKFQAWNFVVNVSLGLPGIILIIFKFVCHCLHRKKLKCDYKVCQIA